jgi:hypothetical protein
MFISNQSARRPGNWVRWKEIAMFRNGVSLKAALAVLFLGGATVAPSQTFFGSVVGTVTDATAAPVAEVTVVLTNAGTADRRTAQTDGNGNYQFLNLVPGSYRVDIEKTGFKHLTRDQVQVRVDNTSRVDGTLDIGEVSQTVEVSAQATLLQTESATLNNVVEGRQVQEMPLNGRNVMNLLALVPGVVPQGSTQGNPLANQNNGSFTSVWGFGNYQIGGGVSNQNITYIDGAPVTLPPNNATSLIPTQDAIQEFSVATNNVSAEFGSYSGGVVNMTTKSGTNGLHGSAYEFLRNRALNANDFFNNRTGAPKPPLTQNQFGAAVNGPVIRNKTFFAFVWEGYSQRKGIPTLFTVPTAQVLAGNFTGYPTIYDPLSTCGQLSNPACVNGAVSRTPFVGNQVPASRFSPTSKAQLFYWVPQNLPGTVNNWTGNNPAGGNTNQYNGRIDRTVSDKQRVFGRYTLWHLQTSPSDPFNNKTGNTQVTIQDQQAILGDTYAFNPSTIADFRISYLRMYYSAFNPNIGADMSQFGPGWAAIGKQMSYTMFPGITITGGYRTPGNLAQLTRENDWSYVGSLTKILGRHTIKAGGQVRRDLWGFISLTNGGGNLSYDATFTSSNATNSSSSGNGFASFLLGYPTTGVIGTAQTVYQQLNTMGFYVNDTFQVTSRLTVTLGLRWEQPGAFMEKHDNNSVWLQGLADPLSKATGLNLVGQPVLVNSPAYPDRQEAQLSWTQFSPRVGISYRVNPRTVVRTGYGISRPPYSLTQAGPNVSAVNLSTTTMVTTLNGGLTPADNNTNPFPSGLIQPAGRTPGFLSSLEGGTIIVPQPYQAQPYVQQWNFNVQRELGSGAMFQVGYAASKGTNLQFVVANTGTVADQLDASYNSMGNALLTQVANPFYGVLPPSVGVLGQKTVAAGYLLKPNPQFLKIYFPNQNRATSTYNALQATFQKRFQAGGTVAANYTWSKFLSDTDSATGYLEGSSRPGTTQDWSNLNANKSLVGQDVPQRLVINYVYDIPVGKGQKLLPNLKGVPNQLLGGWSLNGVSIFQKGFPIAVTALSNALAQFNAGTIRPSAVAGCDPNVSGSAQSRINAWFNTACYQQPGNFSFGNEAREDPKLRGAGIANFDFALNKKVSLTDRVNMNFRVEFFNLMNRVQFAPPASQLGNANFGVVTAAANNPRLVQLALRLAF